MDAVGWWYCLGLGCKFSEYVPCANPKLSSFPLRLSSIVVSDVMQAT